MVENRCTSQNIPLNTHTQKKNKKNKTKPPKQNQKHRSEYLHTESSRRGFITSGGGLGDGGASWDGQTHNGKKRGLGDGRGWGGG